MTTFSTGEGLYKAIANNKEGLYSKTSAIADPNQSLETTPVANTPLEIPKEYLGEYIAGMVQRYGTRGFMPTLEEYKAYDEFLRNKKSEAWKTIGEAVNTATSDIFNAGVGLVGDTLQLKVPKVVGSVIEGTALGTKNWYYMYQQAKYDKNSWLSRAMFDNHDTIEDSYLAFQNAMAVNKEIEKDQKEGIWVPNSVNVGGLDIDLTNKAVVQGLSYVADPSWIMPNLGIEAALAKGLRGAGAGIGLGQQLTKAAAAASRKASVAAGATANFFESIAEGAALVDRKFTTIIGDATGTEHYIAQGGTVTAQEGIVRAGESAIGMQAFKIPAWAAISGTHAASKVFEGVARLGEVGFKILGDETPNVMGNTLSERIAINSTAPNLKKIAGFWSKTGTPVIDWLGQTSKSAMHSSMYGGAFGLTLGGEDGFYHGLGTGLVLGGAFHQIGVLHNTVSGGDAVQDTVKHFLWATESYDRNNQEGLYHLLDEVNKVGGEKAKLSLMGQIAGVERLLKEEKMLILREAKIRELSTDIQWAEYERQWLENPEWGGITFGKLNSKGKEPIIIVNADRAAKSAVSEELFHGILISERYGKAFQKYALDALIGTDDAKGALYKMPTEDAVRMLESFRDQYFSLDKETAGHIPEEMQINLKKFNDAIEGFKNGDRATSVKGFFEEFLASYWNRFIEDKPIDYLLKGGDLGIIRNAIGGAKDWYKNIMRKDLGEAGVQFEVGGTADTFLLDKTTKQRVRIPMLEGLMKHYVKELKKGMYEGWEIDKKKYAGTDSMINGGLDHLFEVKGEGDTKIFVAKDDATVDKELSAGLRGVAEGLLALAPSDRGAKLTVYKENGGGNETPIAQFSRGNKPKQGEPVGKKIPNGKDWWDEQNKTIKKKIGTTGATAAEYDEMGVRRREKGEKIIKGRREQRVPADPQWETDTSGDFWESQFQGNTRVRIEGIATPKELAVFEKFLGENVARRIAQLNTVIESSRVGKTENISNILSAKVITAQTVLNDGTRAAGTLSERAFIPVELNMYFTAVRKSRKVDRYGRSPYLIGEANLLLKVIDWDSYITREDYAFNKVDDSDLNYKTVQRLFGTRTNLREAVKAMLSNYSLGNKAQAGIKLFDRGKGGDRDAALKRDIVNAVIGFHPTRSMVNTDSGWYNTPREMQMLKSDNKVKLPTVMKDFRVDKIGSLKQFEGEGFRYNHNEAYKRAQANFSPAISHRDHEGFPIPISAKNSTADTHYRNKEGELLSVYALRTPYSSIREVSPTHSVYDYVTGELADAVTASSGAVRGHNYTSDSGWLHFTPDKYEAGFVENTKVRSGYIDTQRHINISDIPFGTDYRTAIDKVAFNISNTSGVAFQKVMGDLMMLRDIYGEKLIDGYKAEYNGEATKGATLDEWLFTKAGSALLSKYDIHSVEYMAFNPVTGNEFGSVAILQPSRFVENMTRRGLDNAMHSPSKTVSSQFREQMDAAGSGEIGAMLQWRIDEKGRVVPNTNLITRESVDAIIKQNRAVVKQAQDIVSKGEDLLSPESIKRFEDKIKPFFLSELKRKFPKAPAEILDQIATYSLEGYATYTKSLNELRRTPNPLGGVETYVPQVSLTADSAFIQNASRYGITPDKLRETGLPSLGHWIELSEAEFLTLKNYPKWKEKFTERKANAIKEAREDGLLPDIKAQKKFEKSLGDNVQTELIKYVLAESNGITGLIDNMASRQKQLFFLMDGSMRGNGQIGSDTFSLSGSARKQLSELFLERNQAVLEFMQTFPSGIQESASKKNMLVQWIKAKETLIQSKRNLSAEEHEAIAMYEGYKRKAENIITNDAKTRLLDTLSAFHITEIDMDSVERIRTQLYLEDSKGLIQLGTPEATARAVQLYMLDQGANGVTSLGRIQEAIKINYIKSLENLSKEGFVGVRWVDRELGSSTMSSNNNGVFSVAGKAKKALHAWVFEGTDFAILRKNKVQEYIDTNRSLKNVNPSDVILDMHDGNGAILARVEYSSTLPPEQIKIIEAQFLRDGTNIINREVMEGRVGTQALVEGNFQSVQGRVKELIISMALQQKYGAVIDVGSYELYRNGDTFVATRTDDTKIADVTTTQRIADLEAKLKSGQTAMPNKMRPLRDNEKKQIQSEIAAIQKALKEPSRIFKKGVEEDIDVQRWSDEGEPIDTPSNNESFNRQMYFDRQNEAVVRLKAKLKAGVVDSGKPSGTRPATLEEKIALREQITTLQGQKNKDLGFSFQIDSRHQVKGMSEPFATLKQRNEALNKVRSGRQGNKAFEAYAEEAYVKFEKFIADKKVQEAKLLAQVTAEKGAVGGESVIPQISRLLDELNGLEKKSREFVLNEAKRLKGNTKGKIDLEAMETKIKDREIELRDIADEWELKYLAVAEQLMDNGVLEQQGWTPDRIKELQDRISAHPNYGEIQQLRQTPTGNSSMFITQLIDQMRVNQTEFAVAEKAHADLTEFTVGKAEEIDGLKQQIYFLARRYTEAKGYTSSGDQFLISGKRTDYTTVSTFNFKGLKTYTNDKPHEPSYLRDSENVSGQSRAVRALLDKKADATNLYKSVADLTKEFKDGMLELGDHYNAGMSIKDLRIQKIVGYGRTEVNSELKLSSEMLRRTSKQNLTSGEYNWVNDPMNAEFINAVDKQVRVGKMSIEDAVSAIQREASIANIGKSGVLLGDTVKQLNLTIEKIGVIGSRLDVFGRKRLRPDEGQGNPFALREQGESSGATEATLSALAKYKKTAPQEASALRAELKLLRTQKALLMERYENILKMAGKDAPAGFNEFVAQNKAEDLRESMARRNMKARNAEVKALRALREEDTLKLFKRYDDIARNLRQQNPALRFENSRVPVHPDDPATQYIVYSFGSLAHDFFGPSWRQYDLRTARTSGENAGGITTPFQSDNPAGASGNLRNWIRAEAKNLNSRGVFLADYIHYAYAKREFLMKNPTVEMSAQDANLMKFFFKKDVEGGLFADRIADIPAKLIAQQEAMNNGIIETFSSKTEQERFIKSWVADALDLISHSEGLKTEALKKLSGMTDAQFDKAYGGDPAALEKRLNTVEVIENALMLIAKGRIQRRDAGEVYNVRDLQVNKFTIEEQRRLESIRVMKGWTPAQLESYLVRGLEQNTPKELRNLIGARQQPFLTRKQVENIPIDTLIRMEGFQAVWREKMAAVTNESLFGLERQFGLKKAYEEMPITQRMAMDAPTIKRLLLTNEKQNMKTAAELRKRYKKQGKAILDPEGMEEFGYGFTDSVLKDEQTRVDTLLSIAGAVEASMIRYKADSLQLTNKDNEWTLDHILSLKDNLRVSGAVRGKDNTIVIDWDNPDKPQFRDTLDGRYFIKRNVTTSKRGVTSERFHIFFKGEKFTSSKGREVFDLPTTRFAEVDNITQAQVAIRLFEDDVMRIKVSSDMIGGGRNKFDPVSVGDKPLPLQDPRQPMLGDWGAAGAFSKAVGSLYLENKGSHYFHQAMMKKLDGIGQYASTHYLTWDVNGKAKSREILIYPRQIGILSKHWTRGVSTDGHTTWKYNKPVRADAPVDTTSTPPPDSNTAAVTVAPAISEADAMLNDASKWTIEQSVAPSATIPFEEWTVIKNKLGYTLIKIMDSKTQNHSYKLYNKASMFMADAHAEVEAMEYILEEELKRIHNGR